MVDARWRTVLAVAPYVVLGLLTAFTVGIAWGDASRLIPELTLCAVTAVWILVFRTLRLPRSDGPAAIAVFMTGMILLNLTLVLLDSTFGFLAIATFSFAFSIVPWPWELLAVGATAVVAGLAQSSGFGSATIGIVGAVVVVLLNVVIMCGMSWGLQLAQRLSLRTGVESERTRMAREIHDTLAQNFAGIVTQLQAAEQSPDDRTRARHTGAALDLARDGLAEARRSVAALRPPALDHARLADAIDQVARRWSARTGIPAEVAVSGADRTLATDAEVALLRIAQEALTNVERHAGASRVVLTLHLGAQEAGLEVRDDGRGFHPDASTPTALQPTAGYGLIAMRERVEAIAGRLVVESRPGQGTAIRAEVPG